MEMIVHGMTLTSLRFASGCVQPRPMRAALTAVPMTKKRRDGRDDCQADTTGPMRGVGIS